MSRDPVVYQCPRHGSYSPNYKAYRQEMYVCQACMDAGNAIKKPWREAWETYNRWHRARVPERFLNRRFSNYRAQSAEQKRALSAAQSIAADKMQALALIGSVGTGKTHLSVAIVAEAVRAGADCLWVSVPDLFRQWKQTFAKGAETTEQEILDRINKADVLVLDEIGVANRSEWEAQTLFTLVDDRYLEGGRIVLTGNCSDLASAIGERAADRIDEMGICLTLTGASYRSKAADDLALQIPDDFTKPQDCIEWLVCDEGEERTEVRDMRPPGQRPSPGQRQSHMPLEHARRG